MKAIEYGELKYKDYFICHAYSGFYEFVHKDYDGAPDSDDGRCGFGKTIEECINEINEQIEEYAN